MTHPRTWLAAGVLGLFAAFLASPAAEPATSKSALEANPAGWEDLMPGKDLAGWKRLVLPPDEKLNARNAWSVDLDRKVLICDGVGVKEMLLHDKERGDGIFHVEWRFRNTGVKDGYNSGVYVRSRDAKLWHQIQVAHQAMPPLAGDLFGETLADGQPKKLQVLGKGHEHVKAPGEWNTYEITCKGKTISVWLNGATVTTWNECAVPQGKVGMQAEFFFIEFRNLKFKELK